MQATAETLLPGFGAQRVVFAFRARDQLKNVFLVEIHRAGVASSR